MFSHTNQMSSFRFAIALIMYLMCSACMTFSPNTPKGIDSYFFLCEKENCGGGRSIWANASIRNGAAFFSQADFATLGVGSLLEGYFLSLDLTCKTELTVVAFTGPNFDGKAFVNTCTPGTRLKVDAFGRQDLSPLQMRSIILASTAYTLPNEREKGTLTIPKSLGADLSLVPKLVRGLVTENLAALDYDHEHLGTRVFVGTWGKFHKNDDEIRTIGNAKRETTLLQERKAGPQSNDPDYDPDEPVIIVQAAVKVHAAFRTHPYVAIEFYLHPEVDSDENDQLDLVNWGYTVQTTNYWALDNYIITKIVEAIDGLDFGEMARDKIGDLMVEELVEKGGMDPGMAEAFRELPYSNLKRIDYAFPDPLPCNPLTFIGNMCGRFVHKTPHMVAIPPMLVLHR